MGWPISLLRTGMRQIGSAVAKLWGGSNSFPVTVVFDHLQATETMGHKNLAFSNVSSEAARQFSNGTDAGLSLEHAQPVR